jgi:hypothetical protein
MTSRARFAFLPRRLLHNRDQTPAMPLQATGEFEFQQHGPHDRR